MVKYVPWAFVLCVAGLVSGCSNNFGPVVVAPDPVVRPYVATHLQPSDRIKVTVYGEENLNGVYDVDPQGNVSLPLAGAVRAAGRTKVEVQRAITARYR